MKTEFEELVDYRLCDLMKLSRKILEKIIDYRLYSSTKLPKEILGKIIPRKIVPENELDLILELSQGNNDAFHILEKMNRMDMKTLLLLNIVGSKILDLYNMCNKDIELLRTILLETFRCGYFELTLLKYIKNKEIISKFFEAV